MESIIYDNIALLEKQVNELKQKNTELEIENNELKQNNLLVNNINFQLESILNNISEA